MSIPELRVVLDTNVFITIVAKAGSNRWIFNNIKSGQFSICISNEMISRDADDNKFADCYLCSNAHYLITNDKHFSLLSDLSFPKVNFLTAAKFKEMYAETN